MAYATSQNVLGIPPVNVQITQADWKKFLGQDSTAPNVPLPFPGQEMQATDPIFGSATFVLAFGLAGLQVGEMVVIRSNYAVVRGVATSRGVAAVSMTANTDPTALSWYCILGQCPARVTSGAINLPLYWTATAGSPSATVVATDQITSAFSATAVSATVTTKIINTVNGSNLVTVPNLDGVYIGQAITGTGIPGSTTVSAIGFGGTMLGAQGPTANQLQLSANCTATGSPTATFAHNATFLTALLARPAAAGLG